MTNARDGYVALVLAAGASRRMGPDRNKLVEEIDGRPLVAGVVDAFLEAEVERVVVVLGHEADRVEGVLADRPHVEFVSNPDWREGMGSSLAAGARAVRAEAGETLRGLFVCVGDLPALPAEVISSLRRLHAEAFSADAICVPTHAGRDGHPVLFGSAHLPALAAQSGDRGARAVVIGHAKQVRRLEVDDDRILADVDTPEELARAKG